METVLQGLETAISFVSIAKQSNTASIEKVQLNHLANKGV